MERYSDEELLYLIHCGSEEAEQCLYKYYYKQVKKWVRAFYIRPNSGYEFEDYVQIAMMSFSNIIDYYRDDQKTTFKTFMKMAVLKRMKSYLPPRKLILDLQDLAVISLDEFVSEDKNVSLGELIEEPYQRHRPDTVLKIKEATTLYKTTLHTKTESIEYRVMRLRNQGYLDKEIAKMLDISIKSVYNAAYRYHKKALAIDELK